MPVDTFIMKLMKMNSINRRSFLHCSAAATSALVADPLLKLASTLRAAAAPASNALRIPPAYPGGMLIAEARKVEIWPGFQTDVFTLNGILPGPTIRVQRGANFSAHVMNMLKEPLVLHWHGILAPARLDGHPRDAVGAGASYMVDFRIDQRASTYWYHAHTDLLTGQQAYLGVAGIFIVEDPAEAALGLPSGDHDIPLIVSDKRPDANKQLPYAPTMMDVASGWLGTEVLTNGTPSALLSVDTGLYRLRLVNASNARVFKVGLSDLSTFHLIANDAGLLPVPVQLNSFMLPAGGRAEILVNFDGRSPGSVVKLMSHPFEAPVGHGGGHGGVGGGMMIAGPPQGLELDILTFAVDRTAATSLPVPKSLGSFSAYDPMQAKRSRKFTLGVSHDGKHQINEASFAMERVDFTVPTGELEIWEFTDTTGDFHPMHPHGAHFQVLSRSGAATVPPEDTGWKDTVLVGPMETVRVLIQFDAHEGIFVQHCHTLEHEDDGMMQNFEVKAGAVVEPVGIPLKIQRMGTMLHLSWRMTPEAYELQSRTSLDPTSAWRPVTENLQLSSNTMSVMIEASGPARFFRLSKL